MSKLFPHNMYDPDIINQPEVEYRVAKYPFRVLHKYIIKGTDKEGAWVSTHCPVCFWNENYGLWDCLIDRKVQFCHRCGQKINWDDDPELPKEEE